MPRRLPSPEEAAAILARHRTRPARRPPPPAGRSLAPLIRALDERFGKGSAGLAARWREIVGETLARHTEPVRVVKGRAGAASTLEIRVAGPAAAIVQHQAPEILSRVAMMLGDASLTKLRIVQGPIKTAATAKPQARTRRKGPLDAAAEAELAEGLADAPDGPLKAALLRLGREVLRNR
ncbi:MAG TPA: DciA family protein [Caulobacter sp.]|nr:DciA family protein [Caulobacter sp.]